MSIAGDIWAVVPVKDVTRAKQRLARVLSAELRRLLALTMLEDVLTALTCASGLAGIAVVTVDRTVGRLADRFGARVLADGAEDGHTGAVLGAARVLTSEGRNGMLTVPGDIPLITADEIARLLAAHERQPAFTIVPAHDGRGSNAILCSPPEAVPLRFGDDSFVPHLRAAEQCGLRPNVIRLPGIGLDIDRPEDLAAFMRIPSPTRTLALLNEAHPVANLSTTQT